MNGNPRDYPNSPQQARSPGGGTAAVERSSEMGMMESMKEKAKDVAATAKGKVQEWGSAVADAAGQAKDKAGEWASSAGDMAQDVGENITSFIRRYPIQSLLVGLGVGFLLAKLTDRD